VRRKDHRDACSRCIRGDALALERVDDDFESALAVCIPIRVFELILRWQSTAGTRRSLGDFLDSAAAMKATHGRIEASAVMMPTWKIFRAQKRFRNRQAGRCEKYQQARGKGCSKFEGT